MSDNINSVMRRLLYSMGTMLIIIAILVVAILLFVSFGKGPSLGRGIIGLVLAFISFLLVWLSLSDRKNVATTWYGILSGMFAWIVVGEISPQFGFAKIEAELGYSLLIYLSIIILLLWIGNLLPWGFKIFSASFLLNWWGHSILLNQRFLAKALDEPIFDTTYKITGYLCLLAFIWLVWFIIRKPASKANLIYYGLWLYALLITAVEGITSISSKFGY